MLQITDKRRKAKGKGEKERYTHLNAEFQRIARRDKKAFLGDQGKEIEENNRMGKTRDLFKKIRDTKGTFHAKFSTIKDRNGMDLTEAEDIKKRGIPDHLTCLLRNLNAGQEATVRTDHGTTDWFQIRKGVCQGCIFSPCLFNLYAEYIMRDAGLGETQAKIKIAWRNINNLRYADDTTLMAESEEELRSLLMNVKEESEKVGLKLNIQKTKIMASVPPLHCKQMGKQWKQ